MGFIQADFQWPSLLLFLTSSNLHCCHHSFPFSMTFTIDHFQTIAIAQQFFTSTVAPLLSQVLSLFHCTLCFLFFILINFSLYIMLKSPNNKTSENPTSNIAFQNHPSAGEYQNLQPSFRLNGQNNFFVFYFFLDRFNGQNNLVWSQHVCTFLKGKDMLSHLIGPTLSEDDPNC